MTSAPVIMKIMFKMYNFKEKISISSLECQCKEEFGN